MAALRTASPPSVERALSILEEVSRSKRGLRLPEIALRLGLPKSSTHSVLVALERRGYLQRNNAGRYLFGPKVLILANVALSGMTLREVAYPILAGVMRSTSLAAKMAILDHGQAVLIEQVHPPQVLAPMTWLGKHLDLHCTALGKALAAFQPRQQWSELIGRHTLPRHNDNTICSVTALFKELVRTRERGYAVDNEEFDLGMSCVAVPVFGESGDTVAAIGVTGTVMEVHEGNVDHLVNLLTSAASAIREAHRPDADAAVLRSA